MDLRPKTVRVKLSPTPGYCIKSASLQDATCRVTSNPTESPAVGGSPNPLIIGGPALRDVSRTLKIPRNTKVFINIAWDSNVPPPPEGNEEMIQKAMRGEEEIDDESLLEGGGWFVPVIVSEPHEVLDKVGKPSIVFDCIYNSSLKSRVLKDPSFKSFLTELALQRIEAQHSVSLGRQIGTPNIASKGKLSPRTVLIPVQLYAADHPVRTDAAKEADQQKSGVGGRPLIEEIEPSGSSISAVGGVDKKDSGLGGNPVASTSKVPTPKKSILKTTTKQSTSSSVRSASSATTTPTVPATSTEASRTHNGVLSEPAAPETPAFSWSKEGDHLRIDVQVPKLTRTLVPDATLDVEERRVILSIPPLYTLDLNLDMPDAQLVSVFSDSGRETMDQALTLKRQKPFDVDGAKAKWRVSEKVMVISV